jgi:hypothetical protein
LLLTQSIPDLLGQPLLLRCSLRCAELIIRGQALDRFGDLVLGLPLDLVQPPDPRQCFMRSLLVAGLGLVKLPPRVRHAAHLTRLLSISGGVHNTL